MNWQWIIIYFVVGILWSGFISAYYTKVGVRFPEIFTVMWVFIWPIGITVSILSITVQIVGIGFRFIMDKIKE